MPDDYQCYYDDQIARYESVTVAEFVAMLDAHRAATYHAEAAYLDAWVETQWAYWAIDGRCESREQEERFDEIARSCGFVLIG